MRRMIALTVAAGLMVLQDANAAPTEAEKMIARDAARSLVADLARDCPVAPVNDMKAFEACRTALFGPSRLRASLKSFVLWGRPPAGNLDAPLKDFKSTQFGPDVFSGTYMPMWMFTGEFEFEHLPAQKVYRITAPAGFRNELDFGQYPYPFWHDSKKWADYEAANTMIFWLEESSHKVQQMTFAARAGKPQVAKISKRHVPTFDGKWMWQDANGNTQPAPMLFRGLFSEQNPHLAALDASYRAFALTMRDADCMSCHVPDNPDGMKRLVLLQTPLHAAGEIDRVIKDVLKDRMPVDSAGIEKPLDAKMKEKLLTDARGFARVVADARAWEAKRSQH